MRRFEAIALIIALLAIPLALLARGYACAPAACTMVCCHRPSEGLGARMNCQHSASPCAMKCAAMANPAYGLASPLPPTLLSASLHFPPPELRRAASPVAAVALPEGFLPVPFEPPRS